MELLANGKRILSLPTSEHVPTAVFELSAATEAFSELYGEGAVECAEASLSHPGLELSLVSCRPR